MDPKEGPTEKTEACGLGLGLTLFVTVGTTNFDDLVLKIASMECIAILQKKGFNEIVIQYGKGSAPPLVEVEGVKISAYSLKPSIQEDLNGSDLVIGHAGAGTILETLRLRIPMIAVVNEALMGNHQVELAEAMAKRNYLRSATVKTLLKVLEVFDPSTMVAYPPADPGAFGNLLKEERF